MEKDTNWIHKSNTLAYGENAIECWNKIAETMQDGPWGFTIEQQDYPTFLIDWTEYKVKKISDSVKEGKNFWLDIKIPVTIYFLDWYGWLKQWAYRTGKNMIFMFENADEITLKHEIIHSLEYNKPVPNDLSEFYEKVKSTITEDSFDNWLCSFNFMKSIHEFIADGYSKQPFINALKKENLYDEFIEKTKYIFE